MDSTVPLFSRLRSTSRIPILPPILPSVWESVEKHQQFMNDKVNYGTMLAAVASMVDLSALTMWHIRTTSEPFVALEAPVTEITTFTIHDGGSPASLEPLVQEIVQALNAAPKSIGIVDATFGRIFEADNIVVLIVGWSTVEVGRHLAWAVNRCIVCDDAIVDNHA